MRAGLRRTVAWCLVAVMAASGCTSPWQYVRNGLKVGPNYVTPPAPVAQNWIDAADKRVRAEGEDPCLWWTVFNDPLLNRMMVDASRQNLTLREAGFRILQSRAQLGIAVGEFFPQNQNASGSYTRFGVGQNFFDSWNFGFNLGWELDFWGRYRRAITAAEDDLDASVFDYDAVLVTLMGDIASSYVQVRTDQERIRLLQRIVAIQQNVLTFINAQLGVGFGGVTDVDRAQAESNLKQSLAQIANLEISVRVNQNRLCTLMGIPTQDIDTILNNGPQTAIPKTPDFVIVGMPADLLRRRPDVRRAEREAAAQAELIGIAEADFYPAITVSGTLGWQATRLPDLFTPQGFNSNVGPSFQWQLLNYGRIINNVRAQDARFQQLVVAYQNSVLRADEEVENGIITFLRAQKRARLLQESVESAYLALNVTLARYEKGVAGADFNRYAVIEQNLVVQQDQWAQAQGQVAQGLIQVYRSLGGGWQIRLEPSTGGGPQMGEAAGPPLPNDGAMPMQRPGQVPKRLPPVPEVIPAPK